MRKTHLAVMGVIVAGLVALTPSTGAAQESNVPEIRSVDERQYQGRSLSYWLKVIRDRDDARISIAFDAIRSMGPNGWPAIPELTRLVAAPYSPIRIGRDSDEEIACKLYDIELRSQAIDVLASIGEAASQATAEVIRWALTIRVVPEEMLTRDADQRFVDLVMLDAEYRMRIIAAIAEFGPPARPILARLLKSPDADTRKLSVMILGPDALPIAGDLLKSENCDDKYLAIRILSDIEPLAPRAYLSELKEMLVCSAD
jgi:hypothetical protein